MSRICCCLYALILAAAEGGQSSPVLPSWLEPYPGSAATLSQSSPNLIEYLYTTEASVKEVLTHYERIFAAAAFPWTPNFDGIGTAIRAKTPECGLLIKVQQHGPGAQARVSCAAPTANDASSAVLGSMPAGPSAGTTPPRSMLPAAAEFRREQRERIAAIEAARKRREENRAAGQPGRQAWPNAPENNPPPLVWPVWLVSSSRQPLQPSAGVDQSHLHYLQATFVSRDPMTSIHNFYEDLLKRYGYQVYRSRLATGQTISGVIQNAVGDVEGAHYPYDTTGPRTVIRVGFRRDVVNGPIRVTVRMTAHPRF